MLDSRGFDLWAGAYDQSVQDADENNEYPFAGYMALMNAVYGTVMQGAPANVLDVGIGTALLSKKLYDAGCTVTGIDFSAEMLLQAQNKMPNARLLAWDFSLGVPPAIMGESFDYILSTYALHHLEPEAQTACIRALLKLLHFQGRMLIGDVCFATRVALDKCRAASGDCWDDEENYIVLSALQSTFPGYQTSYQAMSFCAGVIEITNKPA
ncbi:MAG: class I SAM-dependent methyltransferase [Firmicutes bacterium]|nr:class I SAM-dependent methyltransferase [Bacillota bacterium]